MRSWWICEWETAGERGSCGGEGEGKATGPGERESGGEAALAFENIASTGASVPRPVGEKGDDEDGSTVASRRGEP